MPKSKKKKRADFQKVKLKVGKRLPKGDNVTNLSFKTRQIQLTQRIKDDDGQGFVTKKKENVQDLLRQCDHHSSSSRLNAVMGLRELWVNSYTEMMVPTNVHGYSAVLKKLSCLLIDSEATVRHAVVNLFKLILHKITKDSPGQADRLLGGSLFAHLHAFLCCAMNHVHEDIRLDALLLYDTLLTSCPALVVQQTGGLLRNLVGLLAAPSQGHVGSRGNTTTQRLSLNPESKLPVMVFRIRVLARLKRTLMAALDDKLVLNNVCKNVPEHQTVWSLHNDHSGRKKEQNTSIVPKQAVNRFSIMLSGGSHELDDYITNPASLESFIHQCVPVLIQCWKEARADTEAQNESASLLSSDAVEVISLVVSVIQLLFVLSTHDRAGRGNNERMSNPMVSPEVITNSYLTSVEKLMMGGFPYSAQVETSTSKKKKKKGKDSSIHRDVPTETSLTDINLGICDIMSTFCREQSIKFSKIWLKKISLHTAMCIKEAPTVDQCRTIVRIIHNVFSNPHTADHFNKAYKAALKWYFSANTKSQQKKLLYHLFARMSRKWDGWSKTRDDTGSVFQYKENQVLGGTLVSFFQSISQLALTVHSQGDEQWTLDVLKLMCHGHFLWCATPFEDKLSQVLDPSHGLFTNASEQIQQCVCAVISTGVQFSKENLRQLLHLVRCPPEKPIICDRKSWSCAGHVLFAMFANIRERVSLTTQLELNQMSEEQHQQLSDFLRFLFSLQLGFTGEELDLMCPPTSDGGAEMTWFDIVFSDQEAQWERHLEITDIVAREVTSFSLAAEPDLGYKQVFTFMNNFEHFWTQTFSKRKKMHVLSVLGLVHLVLRASQPHVAEQPGKELYFLASLSVAAVLSAMYQQETISALPSALSWQIKEELTRCLASTADSRLLEQVMELLGSRVKGIYGGSDNERQAAKSAQDFLLTDEILRHKLKV